MRTVTHGGATLVIAAGMRAADPVRIDLCTQLQADGRLSPLRVGYQFSDIARIVSAGKPVALRNVALASPALKNMPQVIISGAALADFSAPLRIAMPAAASGARWIGDSAPATFRREGWLLWQDGALRVQRGPAPPAPGQAS
ncbi:hypothetical protein LP419_01790 [Massilia sp. H-1]|nr:hypothetical protein LP419_01790 [Massilia sp. H-1]